MRPKQKPHLAWRRQRWCTLAGRDETRRLAAGAAGRRGPSVQVRGYSPVALLFRSRPFVPCRKKNLSLSRAARPGLPISPFIILLLMRACPCRVAPRRTAALSLKERRPGSSPRQCPAVENNERPQWRPTPHRPAAAPEEAARGRPAGAQRAQRAKRPPSDVDIKPRPRRQRPRSAGGDGAN